MFEPIPNRFYVECLRGVATPDEQHRFFEASINQGLINDLPSGVGTRSNLAPVVVPATIRESYTNGEGKTESYYTNRFGSRTMIEDPLGQITQMERDTSNNVSRVTLPKGNQISYEYDKKGDGTKITNHGTDPPAVTLIQYNGTWNRPTRVEDPEHHVSTLTYDAANGNLLTITDPQMHVTTLTYNTRGQVETVTNAENEVVQLAYYDGPGETGNLRQIIVDPAGLSLTTTLEYDAYGNVTKVIDAETNDTDYVYDVMNLLRVVTDANEHATEYRYDPALGTVSAWASAPLANLKKIIDARAINAVTFAYDDLHRVKAESNAIGKTHQYTYDRADRLTMVQDPKAQNIAYTYDDAGQLVSKTLPVPAGSEVVAYECDANGNLTRARDADSDLSFGFDGADRLTSYSSAAVAGQPALSLTYTYDDDGVVETMTDSTGTTTYGRNANHWLTQITDPAARVTEFGYDQVGRRTSLNNHNGTSVAHSFDDAGRLTDIFHELTGAPFLSLAYTHDRVGNILTVNDKFMLNSYGYDGVSQLESVVQSPLDINPVPVNNESFTYDAVGNRLTSHLSSSHSNDDANELLEDDDFTYTYDDNGNQITKTAKIGDALTTYTYDAENRLICVDLPGGPWAEYRYDALGRRIEKNLGGAITRYTYNAEDILFEYDGSNTVVARFTHGPGIDEPLIMHRDTTGDGTLDSTFHYHADHLGTIRSLTDDAGSAAQSYTYDSFGQIVAQLGTASNPYTYTAREWNSEAGLYYYRNRYYDARSGRFSSPDPLGFWEGVNRYPTCSQSADQVRRSLWTIEASQLQTHPPLYCNVASDRFSDIL